MVNEPIEVAGEKCRQLAITFLADKVLPIRSQQIWLFKNGKAYILTFTSLEAGAEKNQAVIKAMTNSVKWP